jgi:hypothetical protein
MSLVGHNLLKGCPRPESAFLSDSSHKAVAAALTLRAITGREQVQQKKLFDHVVGEREQLVRHVKGNRRCSFEVDHKLELSWLLHGQLGGGPTLENHVDVLSGATVHMPSIDPVRD